MIQNNMDIKSYENFDIGKIIRMLTNLVSSDVEDETDEINNVDEFENLLGF